MCLYIYIYICIYVYIYIYISIVLGNMHTSCEVVGSCTNAHTQCILPKSRVKFDILGECLYSAAEVHRSFEPEGSAQEAPNAEFPHRVVTPEHVKKGIC